MSDTPRPTSRIRRAIVLDEATHTYFVDGRMTPGVSQICEIVNEGNYKPRGEAWTYGASRGTAVHKASELYDADTLDWNTVATEIEGYVAGYAKWRMAFECEILSSERLLHHPLFNYCGKLDRYLAHNGEPWLVDLKTSAGKVRLWEIQIAAYVEALAAELEIAPARIHRASLLLTADGDYTLNPYPRTSHARSFGVFAAGLAIHEWRMTK